jgi:hypothetical protein
MPRSFALTASTVGRFHPTTITGTHYVFEELGGCGTNAHRFAVDQGDRAA